MSNALFSIVYNPQGSFCDKEGRRMDLIPTKDVTFGHLITEAHKQGINFNLHGEITASFRGLNFGHRFFDLKG